MVDPKSRMIEVELISNSTLIVEYNGVKYAFDGVNKSQSIPMGAYIEALTSGHYSSQYLLPVVKDGQATNDYGSVKGKLAASNKTIASLKEKIEELKDSLNEAQADKLAFEEKAKRLEKVEKEKECLVSEIAKLKASATKKSTKK